MKQAIRLRDRKSRIEQGRFVIDGLRELALALRKGAKLVELFVCPRRITDPETTRVVRDATTATESGGGHVYETTPDVMDKLAYGDRDLAVLAIAATWPTDLKRLELPPNPLVIVLENVEKPGNLGAVLRTADAVGANAVVATGHGADPFNPNGIRASQGAVFTVPIAVGTSEETLRWAMGNGLKVFAARVDGAFDHTSADYRGPTALVLGSEAEGLGPVFRGAETTAIRLPMRGSVDSLNVSATAAVLCYEALRQRGQGRA